MFSAWNRKDVDDLVNSLQEVIDIETLITDLEKLQETAVGADAEKLQTQLDAANKALALSKDKCQKLFEKALPSFRGIWMMQTCASPTAAPEAVSWS